jgi:hypothetical protein
MAASVPGAARAVNRKRRHDRNAACTLSHLPQHTRSSYAGLTRVSTLLRQSLAEEMDCQEFCNDGYTPSATTM